MLGRDSQQDSETYPWGWLMGVAVSTKGMSFFDAK